MTDPDKLAPMPQSLSHFIWERVNAIGCERRNAEEDISGFEPRMRAHVANLRESDAKLHEGTLAAMTKEERMVFTEVYDDEAFMQTLHSITPDRDWDDVRG